MAKTLYVDQKVTNWIRIHFNTEEITKEELIAELELHGNPLNIEKGVKSIEDVETSLECISVEDNKGNHTTEIYEGDENSVFQECVWNNNKKSINNG